MNLKEQQPALTIKAQIENLKSLNLIINDEKFAESFLEDVSYYRLVKAFSIGLKPKNKSYYENVTFEQLTELYLFNVKFRQILLSQIETIEINLRCRISNYFCLKYGVLGYKDSINFANSKYHNDFLTEINRNKRMPFIYNFKNNYVDGEIPFYALVEIMSFGTLSKFFKNMLNQDKKEVAKKYNVGYSYLESWIECISFVRNICAHYGRLYQVRLTKKPKLYKQYTEINISNSYIFGVLCCIKHLIKIDENWISFVNRIDTLFNKYKFVNKIELGFPDNWKNILLNNK